MKIALIILGVILCTFLLFKVVLPLIGFAFKMILVGAFIGIGYYVVKHLLE